MKDEITLDLPESGYKAYFKASITYGEHRAIQSVLLKGAKANVISGAGKADKVVPSLDGGTLTEYNMKKMMTLLVKLEDGEGNEVPLSEGTIDDLPMKDGQLLEDKVTEILEDSKKK